MRERLGGPEGQRQVCFSGQRLRVTRRYLLTSHRVDVRGWLLTIGVRVLPSQTGRSWRIARSIPVSPVELVQIRPGIGKTSERRRFHGVVLVLVLCSHLLEGLCRRTGVRKNVRLGMLMGCPECLNWSRCAHTSHVLVGIVKWVERVGAWRWSVNKWGSFWWEAGRSGSQWWEHIY